MHRSARTWALLPTTRVFVAVSHQARALSPVRRRHGARLYVKARRDRWHVTICRLSLADAAAQLGQARHGDLVLVGGDESLVGEVAHHFVDALARGANHRGKLTLCDAHLNAYAIGRAGAVKLSQLQE